MKAGACEAVVRALQKYVDSEAVALAGCRAVVTLARRDPLIQVQQVLANCICVEMMLSYTLYFIFILFFL